MGAAARLVVVEIYAAGASHVPSGRGKIVRVFFFHYTGDDLRPGRVFRSGRLFVTTAITIIIVIAVVAARKFLKNIQKKNNNLKRTTCRCGLAGCSSGSENWAGTVFSRLSDFNLSLLE